MVKTKEITISCPYHSRWGGPKIGYYNACPRSCHGKIKLVCADCGGEITVNKKYEQECLNCQWKELKTALF